MTKTLMIAASALTLAVAVPAYADNSTVQKTNNPDVPAVESVTERDIREGWNDTKDAVSKAWDNTKEAVSNAADDIAESTDSRADIHARIDDNALTADKVIGSQVVDAKGDRVAKVEDLLVDADGNIQGAVVSNGGFMGVAAKKTLVEYSQLGQETEQGKFQTSLTKKSLDMTPAFKDDAVMNGQYRVSELIGAEINNTQGEKIATVDNIVIENGTAAKIVVSYMDGLLPKEAVIDFRDADLVADGKEPTFRVSMSEAADLNRYMRSE